MNMTRDLPVSDADSGSDDEPHSLFDVEQFADAIEHEILSTSSIARTGKVLEVIGTLVKVCPTPITSSTKVMPMRPIRSRLGGSSVLIAACTYPSAAARF